MLVRTPPTCMRSTDWRMRASPGCSGARGGTSQKCTLGSEEPAGSTLARFWYMASVRKGVKGAMSCRVVGKCGKGGEGQRVIR